MKILTMTSREFNQDASRAKKAASDGPVFITDRGRPAHVLLTIDHYLEMAGGKASIVEQLAMANADEIEFHPPTLDAELYRPADLADLS